MVTPGLPVVSCGSCAVTAFLAISRLLMRLVQIELVPDRLEIAGELVALARLERRRTRVTEAREGDAVLALDASRTPAHDDDAVGHADGFADVVRDQDDGLVLVT